MIIYKVSHIKTGKSYIGQTIRDFNTRKAEHLRSVHNLASVKYPAPLHLALRDCGTSEFIWEVLETCTSLVHLNEREKFYIKLLGTLVPNGYNQTTGGAMDDTMSMQVRDRISDSMSALHQDPTYQAKVYPKLKGLVPPNKGVPMTEAQKVKIAAARKAIYDWPGYVNPNKGSTRTEEQKANIRAGQEGRMATGEKWQAAHEGQYTAEVRAKMRAKKLGRKPANTKQVLCIETGEVFQGLSDASKALDINRQRIYLQIKGKLKAAGGKHFKYV